MICNYVNCLLEECFVSIDKKNVQIIKSHTKCSRQSSTATIGGQFRLEIAARLLFPAFSTIRGSTSVISVQLSPPNTPTAVCRVLKPFVVSYFKQFIRNTFQYKLHKPRIWITCKTLPTQLFSINATSFMKTLRNRNKLVQ